MPFDHNKILYKYRGFKNFEFALDIFLNQRLYAADFRSLNDPMEGRFRYSKKLHNKQSIKEVVLEKQEFRILSLSEFNNNHLLWSYYAEGHGGFAVGVKIIPDDSIKVREVNYVDDFFLEDISAENVLSMKHESWQHENEYRVLQFNYNEIPPFVNVEIKELILGQNAATLNGRKVDLLKTFLNKVLPDVEIRTIQSSEINSWIDQF